MLAPQALRAQLARHGAASLRIRGGSMRPLIASGALVELRPLHRGERLVGAIVAVDAGELVVVHRVCREAGAALQTRGIARDAADPWWPRDAVIGVVSAVRGSAAARSETALRVLCAAAAMVRVRWLYRAARLARRR